VTATTYASAVATLDSVAWRGIMPGLERTRALLAALGNPHVGLRGALVAGTNGKGSVCATVDSVCRAAGHRSVLLTSPHLVSYCERIVRDGAPLTESEFGALVARVWEAAEPLPDELQPTGFEVLTAAGILAAREADAEVLVCEVGLGGRLDSTNVLDLGVAAVTNVALDHQDMLGSTIPEIAREKAGIIRPGGVVVTLPQQPEANDVIGNTILELEARAVNAVPYVPPVSPASSQYLVRSTQYLVPSTQKIASIADHEEGDSARPCYRYPLSVMGTQIVVETPLVGRHQLRNVALAIAAADELNRQGFSAITAESIERGIRETRWQGRFQVLTASSEWPEIVLDVAHNPAGVWALRSALSEGYGDRPLIFVFAALADKAISEMTEILFPMAERVIATRVENPRSASPEQVREAGSRTGTEIELAPDVATALQRARAAAAGPESVIAVTGSIYLVGEAMRLLGVSA